MEHLIFIREAITDSEIARFFEKLHSYHRRDIFPEIEQSGHGFPSVRLAR